MIIKLNCLERKILEHTKYAFLLQAACIPSNIVLDIYEK